MNTIQPSERALEEAIESHARAHRDLSEADLSRWAVRYAEAPEFRSRWALGRSDARRLAALATFIVAEKVAELAHEQAVTDLRRAEAAAKARSRADRLIGAPCAPRS